MAVKAPLGVPKPKKVKPMTDDELKAFLGVQSDTVPVAYDIRHMRPGCINVAAGMGGDTRVPHLFDTEDWILYPSENMRVYETPISKLLTLVAKTERHRKDMNNAG